MNKLNQYKRSLSVFDASSRASFFDSENFDHLSQILDGFESGPVLHQGQLDRQAEDSGQPDGRGSANL